MWVFKNSSIPYGLNLDFLDFAFLCATLKVDSARSTCRMDMVDSAFERLWSNVYDHGMVGW